MEDAKKKEKKVTTNLEEKIGRIQNIVADRGEDASKVVKHWLSKDANKKFRK